MPNWKGAVNVNYTGTDGADGVFLDAGSGTFNGKGGDDSFFAKNAEVTFKGGAGNDKLEISNAKGTIYGDEDNDFLAIYEGEGAMYGGGGNDSLLLIVGNALLDGGDGNDTLRVEWGNAEMRGGAGNDSLVMVGGHATIYGEDGDDTLDGGTEWSEMIGGSGNDTYWQRNAESKITEVAGGGTADRIYTAAATFSLDGTNCEQLFGTSTSGQNLTILGIAGMISGNSGNDTITGIGGEATLMGGAGNDSISYSGGTAYVYGGAGNDTILVSLASGWVSGGLGADTITAQSSDLWADYSTSAGAVAINFDTGVHIGSEAQGDVLNGFTRAQGSAFNDSLKGGIGANYLVGNGGDDTLNGGSEDTLVGGDGNDVYNVENYAVTLVEGGNGGYDTVYFSLMTFTLPDNFEKLVITSGGANSAIGNAIDNTIVGSSGSNYLDGGGGNDTMIGGGGGDVYAVDTAGDVIVEKAGEGTDYVYAYVNYTMAANVESVSLYGSASVAIGNSSANYIHGNGLDNYIDGAAGADSMFGGAGNDAYVVDDGADYVSELLGEGVDAVYSSISYTLGNNVENLYLTGAGQANAWGNSADNYLKGNAGANLIVGNAGVDEMEGGLGDDSYFVEQAGDRVIEANGEGFDTVYAFVPYTLTIGLEKLILIGPVAYGYGSGLDNLISGSFSDNFIDGGAGADHMAGKLGNDAYVVDNAGDVVVESASEGSDAVYSSISHALTANVENLYLTYNLAINGTGNSLDNYISGNAAENFIDGGAGADLMIGGSGDDSYVLDNAGDQIIENVGEGNDAIYAPLSHALGLNIENLYLTGSAGIHGTGNGLDNYIRGNGAANVINGGGGGDFMSGGGGNDVYYVDSIGDQVEELNGNGNDTIYSIASFNLSGAGESENLILQGGANLHGWGNALANAMTGNSGDNFLDGRAGADTLVGGRGSDSYVVDNAGDAITENASEGNDAVYSSINYALGSNLENLYLLGTDSINGAGNALTNFMQGNSGNNRLNGGAAFDLLVGNGGNDTFTLAISQVHGDQITDFSAGDFIFFEGFGAGAKITQLSANAYSIDYGAGHMNHVQFSLNNNHTLLASEYQFT